MEVHKGLIKLIACVIITDDLIIFISDSFQLVLYLSALRFI